MAIKKTRNNLTPQELNYQTWGVDDTNCIGRYIYDVENKRYIVDNLRKMNFAKLTYYPNMTADDMPEFILNAPIKGLITEEYYHFRWRLSNKNSKNPCEIEMDSSYIPSKIDPQEFIDTLFDDLHNNKSKSFDATTNFLDTLKKQLTAKESTFIYELLQNANDYPEKDEMVDVQFHITKDYLLFMHSGAKFNVRNISGICGINEKEKIANKKTIGYKGIGFKTVFLHNEYVYIKTGDYSFRFEKDAEEIIRHDAPWAVMPIWTDPKTIDDEVKSIFEKSSENFRVEIALRPKSYDILHTGDSSYENLFKDIFLDSNIILFIPNINSVQVFINGVKVRECNRHSSNWLVNDYVVDIDYELQQKINQAIESQTKKVPDKYRDFEQTQVSFACRCDGNKLIPSEDTTLYCYLPTSASWGFPFLMNTDMIPKGDRNDIETEVKLIDNDPTDFNKEIATITGGRIFEWIKDLLESKKYDLCSVFSIVPNWKKCLSGPKLYREHITRSKDAFDARVKTEAIVPTSTGLANVYKILYDKTGLSSSGIMDDMTFFHLIGRDDYALPLEILRNDSNFVTFMNQYATNSAQIFNFDKLLTAVKNERFQNWLKDSNNNNKFIRFLLDKGIISKFISSRIFLSENGTLHQTSELYYNIDTELEDIYPFKDYLRYLSFATRKCFAEDNGWKTYVINTFATFNPKMFLESVIQKEENRDDVVSLLSDKQVSIHFYNFVATNSLSIDNCKDFLPLFNDYDDLISSWDYCKLFFSSKEGHSVKSSSWFDYEVIDFISTDYTEKTEKFFLHQKLVDEFSHEEFINKMVLPRKYRSKINKISRKSFEISFDFIKYCFEHREFFTNNVFCDVELCVKDCEGHDTTKTSEQKTFFSSKLYGKLSHRGWINPDWMYKVNEKYERKISKSESADFHKFLIRVWGIRELTEPIFYDDVVKENIDYIILNIDADNDSEGNLNFDFISYLDDNYSYIFEQKKDKDLFSLVVERRKMINLCLC